MHSGHYHWEIMIANDCRLTRCEGGIKLLIIKDARGPIPFDSTLWKSVVMRVLRFELESSSNLYPSFSHTGGRVPVDGVIITQKLYRENFSLTLTFYVLACTGILFSLFCLLFNFIYRNHRYITTHLA